MKKLLATVLVLSAALAATAITQVETRFDYFKASGKPSVAKKYQLQKQPDGAMRLHIPVCDIPRSTKQILLTADEFTANKGDDGYFIVPNVDFGYRGFFKYDNGRSLYDLQMAFWGVKSPKGTYVAIAKGLQLEARVILEAVNGVHKLSVRYDISRIDFDPYEDIIVDFYKLEGKDADFVGMAKKYRKYMLDSGAVVPLKERVKNNPTLKYTVESLFVRIKMAYNKRPKNNISANDPAWDKMQHELNIVHNFDSFMDILRKMNEAGVGKADVCFVGWQVNGFDGYFPDLFPVEERLGGEAKMREAVKLGKSFGYHMTTHINNHNMYKRAKRWSLEDVCKNRKGEPRTYVVWPGGQAYHTCFQTICDRYMDSDIAHLKDIGMNAPQHVDVTSAIRPTPCCDPLHPNNRKEIAQHQIRLGEKYHKAFGGFTSEAGYDHVAKILDYALYTSRLDFTKRMSKKRYEKAMTTPELLPIWQIVYHGIILSNIDWDTIDAYLKPKGDTARLKLIESGSRPTFYWTDYKKSSVIDGIAEAWRDYQKMSYLQYEFMDRYETIAKDVVLVGYSDGSEVVVNYSDKPFEYGGKSVGARAFELFPAKKRAQN